MSEKTFQSRLITRLASLEVALAFLLFIGIAAIPGTLLENRHAYYGSVPFILLLAGFSANLIFCTIHRWRHLAKAVLVVHLGVLLTIGGFVVRELTGTVATINVYEGEPANSFYLPYTDVDVDLGFSLLVHKIHTEYYPVPLRIGVMKGAEKVSLHTVKTGESFTLSGYRVVVEGFDPLTQAANLSVYEENRLVGKTEASDAGKVIAGFPLLFKLVAFQTPQIKRSWVDIELKKPNSPPLKGESEVNRPLSLDGYEFYYVQNAYDDNKRIYAGIQIVKDPGRLLTFFGMAVAALGAIMTTYRRMHGTR